MKNLAFSRRFIFTLFAVLFSVNLWGQIHIDNSCKIDGVSDYYIYTGSVITINPRLSTYYYTTDDDHELVNNIVSADNYSVQYYKNGESIETSQIVDEGYYTLTIRANAESGYTGTISNDFYIVKSHTLSGSGTSESPYIIND